MVEVVTSLAHFEGTNIFEPLQVDNDETVSDVEVKKFRSRQMRVPLTILAQKRPLFPRRRRNLQPSTGAFRWNRLSLTHVQRSLP